MKVNVLVVAAMVIASVNAVWHERLPDCVGRICESWFASSRDFSEKEWNKLKGRDPTSVQDAHDLNEYGIIKNPDCWSLFAKLKDLQKRITRLSDKYSSCQSALCKIKIKTDSSKSNEIAEYLKSHSTIELTVQKIERAATALRKEYKETWISFLNAKCLDQSNPFFSPSKIEELEIFLVKQQHSFSLMETLHRSKTDHCILCDQQLLSTSIAHLVVECEQVTGHRIQSGLVPAIQKSRLRLLGRALDPGVENVYTWLRGGVLNGEADLNQRWLDGGLWSMNLWGRGMIIGR
ncbi:hypothetical protein BASA61_001957 [Batrachochytrium salamandrivorans]|nr:hypothetical protein BASA61_001957 [Batrachochytrium salamandrivorans]